MPNNLMPGDTAEAKRCEHCRFHHFSKGNHYCIHKGITVDNLWSEFYDGTITGNFASCEYRDEIPPNERVALRLMGNG